MRSPSPCQPSQRVRQRRCAFVPACHPDPKEPHVRRRSSRPPSTGRGRAASARSPRRWGSSSSSSRSNARSRRCPSRATRSPSGSCTAARTSCSASRSGRWPPTSRRRRAVSPSASTSTPPTRARRPPGVVTGVCTPLHLGRSVDGARDRRDRRRRTALLDHPHHEPDPGRPPHAERPRHPRTPRPSSTKARLRGKRQTFLGASCSMIALATSCIVRRRSIDAFWIQRNASGSRQAHLLVEEALRAVDELAGLEALDHVGDLGLERDDLLVAGQRDLDRRQQVVRRERLHDVGEGARLARALDELLLAERRQQHDGGDVVLAELLGRARCRRAAGILTSMITRSGRSSVASWTAVSPSPASPTTSKPLSRRISTMSRRMSDSSSATTTRRGADAAEPRSGLAQSPVNPTVWSIPSVPGPVWRNGRRDRLKIGCPKGRVGSSPTTGTLLRRDHAPRTRSMHDDGGGIRMDVAASRRRRCRQSYSPDW